jgi:hypothetical protein
MVNWTIGVVTLVVIALVGALRDRGGWFRWFSGVWWLGCLATILIYGVGLLFVPLALAYSSAHRQRQSALSIDGAP